MLAGFLIIVLIGVGAAYIMFKSGSSQGPSPTPGTSVVSTQSTSSSQSVSSQNNNFYFLVLTQKGISQVINPFASAEQFLGFQRVTNISVNVPQQVYYWDEPSADHMLSQQFKYILVPINNGTVLVVNTSTMQVVKTFTVGNSIGFIGVAYSPNGTYAAIADGPSGVVMLVNMNTLQVVWEDKFVSPTGKTYYPCDVRWDPNGEYLIVPMRFNNSVVLIDPSNGKVVKEMSASLGSQPYMVSPNMQGTMVAVEYAGNNSVGFYSLPDLKYLGMVQMPQGVTPQRGTFTPNGAYYLEAPINKDEVIVISTSNFEIVKNITLPSISPQGLADIEVVPGTDYAYVVIHGSVSSGGMIVLIDLNTLTVAQEVPLTTAPAIVLPMSASYATYLVNNVMLPPVTGLHC